MASPSVLFVCLGNICRSPTAEGIFRQRVAELKLASGLNKIDSCGTSGAHDGCKPDERSVECAEKYGVFIGDLRSRKLRAKDFEDFSWIVCMDRDNYSNVMRVKPATSKANVVTFMQYVPGTTKKDVPDPYYGEGDGFDLVFKLLDSGMPHLLHAITGLPLDSLKPKPAARSGDEKQKHAERLVL